MRRWWNSAVSWNVDDRDGWHSYLNDYQPVLLTALSKVSSLEARTICHTNITW